MPFRIVRQDITCMTTDVIVNTANPKPIYSDGTDRAIYVKAGAEKLLKLRRKIGDLQPGQVAVTPGLELPAKYIIHAVGPVWMDGYHHEAEILQDCYQNALNLALKKRCKSIAFPLMASGSNGFPKELALSTALDVFRAFLQKHEMEIILTVFDKNALTLSEELTGEIDSYIDDHYVERKNAEEYLIEYSEKDSAGNRNRPECDPGNLPEAEKDFRNEGRFIASYFEKIRPIGTKPEIEKAHRKFLESIRLPRQGSAKSASTEQSADLEDLSEDRLDSFEFQKNAKETNEISETSEILETPDYAVFEEISRFCDESERPQEFYEETPPQMPPRMQGLPKNRGLEELLKKKEDTFQQYLMRLIKEKGMKNVEVYTRANLDRKLFSKIKSNENYNPKKNTALALCIGLMLNLEEAEALLARAGYAFSPSNKVDVIVRYFIEHRAYDVLTIETVLYDHDLPLLSNYA